MQIVKHQPVTIETVANNVTMDIISASAKTQIANCFSELETLDAIVGKQDSVPEDENNMMKETIARLKVQIRNLNNLLTLNDSGIGRNFDYETLRRKLTERLEKMSNAYSWAVNTYSQSNLATYDLQTQIWLKKILTDWFGEKGFTYSGWNINTDLVEEKIQIL